MYDVVCSFQLRDITTHFTVHCYITAIKRALCFVRRTSAVLLLRTLYSFGSGCVALPTGTPSTRICSDIFLTIQLIFYFDLLWVCQCNSDVQFSKIFANQKFRIVLVGCIYQYVTIYCWSKTIRLSAERFGLLLKYTGIYLEESSFMHRKLLLWKVLFLLMVGQH